MLLRNLWKSLRFQTTIFAGCEEVLVVLDATNGKIMARLPIGGGCDGIAFDNSSKEIFTANGAGTMTVIKEKSANSYSVEGFVPTQNNARTIAIDQSSHRLYLPVEELGPNVAPGKRPAIKPETFKFLVVK